MGTMYYWDQEFMGLKLDPVWRPDGRRIIREVSQRPELQADIGSDILLRFALQRRSLTFDQCALVQYEAFELWSNTLIEAYFRPPPDGYRRVSLKQLQADDLE